MKLHARNSARFFKHQEKWKLYRFYLDKLELSRIKKEINYKLTSRRNQQFQDHVNLLITDNSIWKPTRNCKQPIRISPFKKNNDTWARSDLDKANVFSEYLEKVFTSLIPIQWQNQLTTS